VLSSYVVEEWAAEYTDVLTSSHITIDTDGFIKTAAGDWFRTFDFLYPLVVCNQDPECGYAYEPICIEAVDVGGTPSKCLGQMEANIAKNGRKIYMAAEDQSMEGWLELDGALFKPLAVSQGTQRLSDLTLTYQTRETASIFYIPGLGNGTVAQELYTSVNGGYNSWWGPYITHN
jgi:hypothetical protein